MGKKASTLTAASIKRVMAKFGIKEAPRDHPIYKEGPSVRFINRSGMNTGNTSGKSASRRQT